MVSRRDFNLKANGMRGETKFQTRTRQKKADLELFEAREVLKAPAIFRRESQRYDGKRAGTRLSKDKNTLKDTRNYRTSRKFR